MALRTIPTDLVSKYFRDPIRMVPPTPQEIYPGFIDPSKWVNTDWDDPTPIYCMRSNPYIQNIRAAVCRPNKAAIAEMAGKFKSVLPGGEVIIKAENGNGEPVEIAVNGNGEVVAETPAPNLMPLVLAAAAAFFFLM